ncbi:hypothetical protein COU60_05540 [Candidatus Pacearchaeota archaeon CG10_big_fil_rev_8_21_14_0_10_34_76]|nr:MAG: hypothetical protein COU60_05540 [Candidatus Pacearchaeota archaeon CG10_big_fil_rev_8_21_14_0_10_34_76]
MKFRIPFTIASEERLKKKSRTFRKFVKPKKNSKLKKYLENSDTKLTREEYISISIKSFITAVVAVFVLSTTLFLILSVNRSFLLGLGLALLIASFVAFVQIAYPKINSVRKQKNIEKNLIPALEDMLVQLNSGIPLFDILINVSYAEYGELSREFKKAVKKINAGLPQVEVLEELGENNPSIFFRRALWQISNGMKAGSNISEVVKDSISALNEEQLLQIQNYGNKLNPLIMFYMLISVIFPALAITFLTILSSLVNLTKTLTILLFISMYIFVIIIQIMFLGVIRSSRPSLL